MGRWTEQEIEYLNKNFKNTNFIQLQSWLGRSRQSIACKAHRLNLIQDYETSYLSRTIEYNYLFFKQSNILNSYWAGFIAADGNIYKNQLKIHINLKDKILLERFKQDIQYAGEIHYHRARGKTKESASLTISGKNLVQDLYTNFNITPKKSLTLEPPIAIDEENALSYITGLLDGDGTIRIRKDKNILSIKFNGTKKILSWIKYILSNITPIKANIHTYSSVSELVLLGKTAEMIGKKLKSIPIDKLDRKWGIING